MTQPGKLSEVARHVVLPSGIVSTGWPAVRERCREMGVPFDSWQDGIGRIILSKRADGMYACTIGGVAMSIPRQTGKSHLIGGLVFALCLLNPGMTVIWTAHRLKTAEETFGSMQGMAQRLKVAPHVSKVTTGSGDEAVYFRNGSRILFGARERGFGRGFARVDVLIFDEAQILGASTLEDMIPATNRSQQPSGALVIYAGTPPRPQDKGEVFSDLRSEALEGRADDMAYIEFSADKDADPDDLAQLARANPSFPRHTPLESIMRMRRQIRSDAGFLREGMGIWDAQGSAVVDPVAWSKLADMQSVAVSDLALALEVSPDREVASVALAGRRFDGLWHVELIAATDPVEERHGVEWVVDFLAETLRANPNVRALAVASGTPAASLIPDLRELGVAVTTAARRDEQEGCGQLLDAVTAGRLRHIDQSQLAVALSVARKKMTAGGSWVWNRGVSGADITPIAGVSLAMWASQTPKPERPRRDWGLAVTTTTGGGGGWVM